MGNKTKNHNESSSFYQALADVIYLTTKGLKRCPMCGGEGRLIVKHPKYFGLQGAYVECRDCGMRTRVFPINEVIDTDAGVSMPVTEESVERGKLLAMTAWNRREYEEAKG